jgi:AraC-like DNA-binding protein
MNEMNTKKWGISDGASRHVRINRGRSQVSASSIFLTVFRDRLALPPHAYQLQRRVFRARELLRVLPPAQIAQQCGFSDQSHFHRVFPAMVGTTPGRYAGQFHSVRPQQGGD